MRVLPRPTVSGPEILAECFAAVQDAGLQQRLLAIEADMASTAIAYNDHAIGQTLHLVPSVNAVGGVTKDELASLYDDHMSSPKGVARGYYDQLRNAAPNKKCPLCGVGTVAVLDHHLPKSKYPDLSVLPINLVPACHFCNDTKKARYPSDAGQQTLHPYFDQALIETQWVKATLNANMPVAVIYGTSPPATWSPTDRLRVQRHFDICGLGIVYSSNASDELAPLKLRLMNLFERGGPTTVQEHLKEGEASYATRPNSWQFALYQELSQNHWFVSGGFASIS